MCSRDEKQTFLEENWPNNPDFPKSRAVISIKFGHGGEGAVKKYCKHLFDQLNIFSENTKLEVMSLPDLFEVKNRWKISFDGHYKNSDEAINARYNMIHGKYPTIKLPGIGHKHSVFRLIPLAEESKSTFQIWNNVCPEGARKAQKIAKNARPSIRFT